MGIRERESGKMFGEGYRVNVEVLQLSAGDVEEDKDGEHIGTSFS